ncbi:ATPase, V1 complex, subunit C [Fomitiporia mediterranea MF3/22]|uniref:ATPase, V1 complex, subunit C n=1 Tax=Fomitiporia mediterranea (strain MF3/22) TaxID=694068 RepID=UPI0004408E82|nr:ATPase, V1 complex, subunit C [Fomitiporia mediterranea MF3/22]EJD04380.1 ATPase, V1 complex, subunit C [Fomitiporia mediterranea MF3/22]
MPSDQSTWLISAPHDGDSEDILQELTGKIQQQSRSFPPRNISEFGIPSFKTGTLDLLVTLSEDLPKQDTYFTSVVAKIVDTLRNLLNNDPQKLSQHTLVDERPVESYILQDWRWNEGRYSAQKSAKEIADTLSKELSSIDNVMKAKLNNYNLAKGQLVQLQRKRTGNLSVRSLVDIVSKDDIIEGSEFLETVFVAIPKALVKDWKLKYERISPMVVPRSANLIDSDDEYSLFGVVIFKRVRDEFSQKCRENKFIVRDFVYTDELAAKHQQELDLAGTTEKELWTELLRISRTNFSEAFKLLVHLKVLRLFVESVLRYGLPASYIGIAILPEPKSQKKILQVLNGHFAYLAPRSNSARTKVKAGTGGEEFLGEYQTLMEQEFLDYVIFDVPWIVN